MAIISVVIESPVSPLPSILALLFVIFVTMIKQGYEDFLRHRADGAINRKEVTQVGPDSLNTIQSQKIQVITFFFLFFIHSFFFFFLCKLCLQYKSKRNCYLNFWIP